MLIVKSQDYEYDYEFADDYGNIPIVRPIVKKKRGIFLFYGKFHMQLHLLTLYPLGEKMCPKGRKRRR